MADDHKIRDEEQSEQRQFDVADGLPVSEAAGGVGGHPGGVDDETDQNEVEGEKEDYSKRNGDVADGAASEW